MNLNNVSVLVIGNFGYRTGQIDGQTVKTRVLKEAFADFLGEDFVRIADSSWFSRRPIRFFNQTRNAFKDCNHVVMLPGIRGLYIFLPLFLYWKKKWGRSLQYVVIGGWLPDLLEKRTRLLQLCSMLDGIYVETSSMERRLNKLGLRNVDVVPNFRKFSFNIQPSFPETGKTLKLVFYSRVIKEKGIEYAIKAVQLLSEKYTGNIAATLDIYGPIPDSYKGVFMQLLSQSKNVAYCGVLAPEDAVDKLRVYDLLIFPTYYEGEGFPGALLDSFIAGLPVMVSDWKYNSELVVHEKTGFIFRVHSVEDIVFQLESFLSRPECILKMRYHCVEEAKKYHVENVVSKLLRSVLL